jgi:hypothetical protein
MDESHQILYSNELRNRLSESLNIQENLRAELNVMVFKNKQDGLLIEKNNTYILDLQEQVSTLRANVIQNENYIAILEKSNTYLLKKQKHYKKQNTKNKIK